MRHGHVVSFAVLALILFARTASADSSDDDDGFVEASPSPSPSPSPNTSPRPTPSPRFPSHLRDQALSDDPHRGVLGPARLGALAGVGAPSIFSGEVLAKVGDYFGIAGDYGVAPQIPFPVGGAAVSFQQKTFTGSARVYPFRGAFFIGAGAGSQTTTATASAATRNAVPTSTFTTSVLFLEPEIGILYRSSSGISLGCDVGLEFPVTAQRTNSASLPASMDSAMKYAEKGPIPSVNLLRVGYVL